MLNKFILCAIIFVFSTSIISGQTSEDHHTFEVFGGYSNSQVDVGAVNRLSFQGFEASGVKNITRYVGFKADISGGYRSNKFTSNIQGGTTTTPIGVEQRSSLYNFLGGIQIKDNAREGRFKPFVHALVGVAHTRSKITELTCLQTNCSLPVTLQNKNKETGFAAAFGGGLDIKVNNRFSVRAVQIDYNPTRFYGSTQHNVRFGVGVVFH